MIFRLCCLLFEPAGYSKMFMVHTLFSSACLCTHVHKQMGQYTKWRISILGASQHCHSFLLLTGGHSDSRKKQPVSPPALNTQTSPIYWAKWQWLACILKNKSSRRCVCTCVCVRTLLALCCGPTWGGSASPRCLLTFSQTITIKLL